MKQFHFSSNLSTLMELYLTTRNEEGYLSDHYGYYLQELDCLSNPFRAKFPLFFGICQHLPR